MCKIDGAIRTLEAIADGRGVIVTPAIAAEVLEYLQMLSQQNHSLLAEQLELEQQVKNLIDKQDAAISGQG